MQFRTKEEQVGDYLRIQIDRPVIGTAAVDNTMPDRA